jgi:hypothetical protein
MYELQAAVHACQGTPQGKDFVVHDARVLELAQTYRNMQPLTKEAVQVRSTLAVLLSFLLSSASRTETQHTERLTLAAPARLCRRTGLLAADRAHAPVLVLGERGDVHGIELVRHLRSSSGGCGL